MLLLFCASVSIEFGFFVGKWRKKKYCHWFRCRSILCSVVSVILALATDSHMSCAFHYYVPYLFCSLCFDCSDVSGVCIRMKMIQQFGLNKQLLIISWLWFVLTAYYPNIAYTHLSGTHDIPHARTQYVHSKQIDIDRNWSDCKCVQHKINQSLLNTRNTTVNYHYERESQIIFGIPKTDGKNAVFRSHKIDVVFLCNSFLLFDIWWRCECLYDNHVCIQCMLFTQRMMI